MSRRPRISPSGPLDGESIPPGDAVGDVPTWDGNEYLPEQPSGGGVELIAQNGDLPFDIPISGTFGAPDGMTVAAQAGLTGDVYLIDVWALILEGGGNPQAVEARIYYNETIILNVGELTVGANENMLHTMKYAYTLLADDATPEFSPRYHASGAGPDVVAGTISVSKYTP